MKNCTFTDNFIAGHRHCSEVQDEPAFALPVFCTGGGHCLTDQHTYRYHGLQRGNEVFCFWEYTISGSIALELGGETRRLGAGEAMLLAVPEDHCYYLPPESDHWDSVYLVFSGYDSRKLVNDIRATWGSVFPVAPSSETLNLARERLELLAAGKVFSPYESSAFAMRFLMTLAGELARADASMPSFVEAVRLLVKSDPRVSLAKMCRVSGYSKPYFERRFRHFTGVTPAAYRNEQRLAFALELLRHTRTPIGEIAERSGFRDSAYFCRVFRKKFGCAPGQWRSR